MSDAKDKDGRKRLLKTFMDALREKLRRKQEPQK